MATNNTGKIDYDLHKRKIFIQKLSSETTKRSLEDYFSKYPIQWCGVPLDETGKNKMHGMVVFLDEESVDDVMSQRQHEIDRKVVFIHRSVPMEQSSKNNTGIQQLIVSGVRNQSLAESDIRRYFSQYGEILNANTMKNDDNIWAIDFDYYDSVDKILLNIPHRIGRIDVNVKKGDRRIPPRRSSTSEATADSINHSTVMSKKSNLKQVTINERISHFNLPPKKYCIHVTNLPINTDAETLSDEFEWKIHDIVMAPWGTECLLKNANDEAKVDEFIRNWNRKTIGRSTIQCEKEEDILELCNKFQFGRCRKSDDECNWEHIRCTAQGTCASTCSYGHERGVKSERESLTSPTAPSTDYRIKLTGFKSPIAPNDLTQLFGLNCYYIDRKNEYVGYAVKIKTMKYAKQFITKWHDKDIGDQRIKCQLELNPRSNRAASPSPSVDGKRKRYPSHSRSEYARSLPSSQGTSDHDDTDSIKSISFDNREVDRDRRISGKALQDITQTSSKTNLNRTRSSENIVPTIDSKYQLPSDVLANEWEITNKAPNSDGKVLLIRAKVDRKLLAAIKIYLNQSLEEYNREINAMKELKDVKGVSQLIQYRANLDNPWIIMERAPGKSLKEYIERTCQGVLEISTAIRLTLNLIEIIQAIHDKGVCHQNLSPENIMIEWNLKSSIDRAQITVLNFSRCVSASNKTHTPIASSTEKWYHVPQIDDQGLNSTVDPSGICAILFWLLTQIDPIHDNGELPHQQARDKLDDMIKSAVKLSNVSRHTSLEEQLRRYLIDTFDRAFGYPHYHPWTINDLKCRLESILEWLMPSETTLDTIDTIFESLISISDSVPIPLLTAHDVEQDAFLKAAKAFSDAKKYFLENGKNQYQWSDGYCTWVHQPHSWINERRNDDILTYSSFRGRMTTSYSVIITCLARSSEDRRVITLFIGSNVNGKTIEIPIGQYSTTEDYTTIIQENFKIELMNMLSAIYKQRRPIGN